MENNSIDLPCPDNPSYDVSIEAKDQIDKQNQEIGVGLVGTPDDKNSGEKSTERNENSADSEKYGDFEQQ